MTIRYECTDCGAVLKIRDDKAGNAAHCPQCKVEFVVPAADSDGAGDAGVASPPALPSGASPPASDEDEALAFLLEGGDVPKPPPVLATDADADADTEADADADGEVSPAKPAPPGERQLHRTDLPAATSAASAAGTASQLLSQTDPAASAGPVEEDAPRVDMADVREVSRVLLPILGIVVVLGLFIFLIIRFNPLGQDANHPDLFEVSGVVTLDGKPLSDAEVTFEPNIDPNIQGGSTEYYEAMRRAASRGRTNEAGEYTLSYVGGFDGAVPGKHTVRVNAKRVENKMSVEILPPRYHRQSVLTKQVDESGGPYNFDLKSDAGSAPAPPAKKAGS